MASPLNRVPSGLLDFFGIKSGEWGPRELGQVLTPTIDLTRWYSDFAALEVTANLQTDPIVATTGFAALSVTSTSPVDLTVTNVITVPQTELWLILEAAVHWTFSSHAGSDAEFWWSSTGRAWPQRRTGYTTSLGTLNRAGANTLASPQWVTPGQIITPICGGAVVGAGGSISLTSSVAPRLRLIRFKV